MSSDPRIKYYFTGSDPQEPLNDLLKKIRETYKDIIRKGSSLEHETPVHEYSIGRHGSTVQSSGGLANSFFTSSIATTVKYTKTYKNDARKSCHRQLKQAHEQRNFFRQNWLNSKVCKKTEYHLW